MPFDRLVKVVSGEPEGFTLGRSKWQLIGVDVTGNQITVGAHDPGLPWNLPGSVPTPASASVLTGFAANYFIDIPDDRATTLFIAGNITDSAASLGPLNRNGQVYPPGARAPLGRAIIVATSDANPASSKVVERIDRVNVGFLNLPVLSNPLWTHRLGDQVTFLRPGDTSAATTFTAWCELLDITAADQLTVTAAGVDETGTRYDVRVRVRHDSRWSTELIVEFDGLRYSVVSVQEDTEAPPRRAQILGLRRYEAG